MNELAGQIEEALSLQDPRQGIARAKQLVRNSLVRAEPRAEVRETEFFDHTFAPDLVILHPGGRTEAERWVYLRTTIDPGTLAEDLAATRRASPMFISLGEFQSEPQASPPYRELDAVSAERDSLVIDTAALAQLSEGGSRPGTAAVMARALVGSGRGAMNERETDAVLATFATGADAAMTGLELPTRQATTQARERLTDTAAEQVTAFLGALWEGSGRPRSAFPGTLAVSPLDGQSLRLLLEGPEIDNDRLWARLAETMTLRRLVDSITGHSPNLQRLIQAGLETIAAHVCIVEPAGLFPADGAPEWTWVARRRWLSLHSAAFSVHVAERREDLPEVTPTRNPVGLEEVRRRAQAYGIALQEVRMTTSNRTVGYDSISGDDIAHDRELDVLERTLGNPTVAHIEARPAGEPSLACDFVTGIAGMVGPRARMGIGRLVTTAVQLLEALDETDAEQIAALTRPRSRRDDAAAGEWEQTSLFEGQE